MKVLWSEKRCVYKKQIHHKDGFNFKLRYESSVHNIVFSSENVISSESEEKYAEIKHNLQVQTVKINMLEDFDAREK